MHHIALSFTVYLLCLFIFFFVQFFCAVVHLCTFGTTHIFNKAWLSGLLRHPPKNSWERVAKPCQRVLRRARSRIYQRDQSSVPVADTIPSLLLPNQPITSWCCRPWTWLAEAAASWTWSPEALSSLEAGSALRWRMSDGVVPRSTQHNWADHRWWSYASSAQTKHRQQTHKIDLKCSGVR